MHAHSCSHVHNATTTAEWVVMQPMVCTMLFKGIFKEGRLLPQAILQSAKGDAYAERVQGGTTAGFQ